MDSKMIFENEFLSIIKDSENDFLQAAWKTKTVNMNRREHQHSLRKLFEYAKAAKPSSMIFNFSNFFYALDELEQDEIAQLSEEVVHEGLEKCALIPSRGMMEQLAVEQTVKKVDESIAIRFFRDELTAKQWLGE
ncbi:MAG: hypothetical protein ACPGJS_21770 [Flammeovirgaceae bacterium]